GDSAAVERPQDDAARPGGRPGDRRRRGVLGVESEVARGAGWKSSFPRKRESMLSTFECDDSRKLVGSRWIPAFAGMTNSRWIPAFAGMTNDSLHTHSEPLERELLQLVAHRGNRQLFQHFGRERVGEQPQRYLRPDAATLEIEQRCRIDGSDRGPVRALDVVGVDLELRLCIDARTFREKQVVVALLAIGLLCFGPDVHLAVEDRVRLAVHDTLVQLVAGAALLGVDDARLVINGLLAIHEIQSIQRNVRAFAVEQCRDVRAREISADGERECFVGTVAALIGVPGSDVVRAEALALDL